MLVTTRDIDSWHASTLKTVDWRANDPELRAVAKWDWGAGLYHPMLRKFWDCFFKGDFETYGKDVFREHYANIRELVPKENLLEFKVSQGWEPLCEFLDVPVPSGKFPHTNDTEGFVDRCKARNRAQMYNVAFRALLVGGSVMATLLSASLTLQRFGGVLGATGLTA